MIKREFRHDLGSTVIVTFVKPDLTKQEEKAAALPRYLQWATFITFFLLVINLMALLINSLRGDDAESLTSTLLIISFLIAAVNIILFALYHLTGKHLTPEKDFYESNRITNNDVGHNIVNRLFQLHQYATAGFNTKNLEEDIREIMAILDAGFGTGHADSYTVDKSVVIEQLEGIISVWESNLAGSNKSRKSIRKLTDFNYKEYDNSEQAEKAYMETALSGLKQRAERADFITDDKRNRASEHFKE